MPSLTFSSGGLNMSIADAVSNDSRKALVAAYLNACRRVGVKVK
jgi:hypothetical protein